MFQEETCSLCGMCLSECPFLEMPEEQAQEEISMMIETKYSEEIIKKCVSCGSCNTICPTESNPFDLIREMKWVNNAKEGVSGLFLNTEEIPANIFSIVFDLQTDDEKDSIKRLSNPQKNTEMFWVGCALPYFFPDLLETQLFHDLPIIGGMKYCCGAYVFDHFGIEEAALRGKALLNELHDLGVKKLITLCSACEMMLRTVYPKLIEGFDIQAQGFMEYFLEKYRDGKLQVVNHINKKVTFHDPCPWRELDPEIYEIPRELLKILGAEVVEMKHNRQYSICCGNPPSPNLQPQVSKKVNAERVAEAAVQDVEAIAVNCTGCLGLSRKALEKNIQTYHMIELIQMAVGETHTHRINETLNHIDHMIMQKIGENPQIMHTKYTARNGKFHRL